MKFIPTTDENFVFHLAKPEKRLLFAILQMYPLLNAAAHRLSRNGIGPEQETAQKLLEEAMEEHRRAQRAELDKLLDDPSWISESAGGFHLTLSRPRMEWLLQVLNDLRVGSWMQLGCPDPAKGQPPIVNEENIRYYGAMEFSGFFQMALLQALEHGE
jgi:hypothetical protein